MFRKKDEDGRRTEAQLTRDEHAYEDNWYRSLKAMSERADGTEAREEPVEADAEDSAGAETPDVADEGSDSVAGPSDELEARAGALLERLRALTHLGDEESESSSARG